MGIPLCHLMENRGFFAAVTMTRIKFPVLEDKGRGFFHFEGKN